METWYKKMGYCFCLSLIGSFADDREGPTVDRATSQSKGGVTMESGTRGGGEGVLVPKRK